MIRALAAARRRGSEDRGIVLVAVLWLLALLGGLTAAMSMFAAGTLSAIDVYKDRPRAAGAVAAGLDQAVARVLDVADDPAPSIIAGTATVAGARVSFEAVAESARVDANTASAALLTGLFVRLGAPADVAAGDASLIVGLRGFPAAAQAVPGQAPGYNPDEETPAGIAAAARGNLPKPGERDPHKPILDVLQLQQIPGLQPDLMARAAPFMTTFSGMAEINPVIAAPEVIEAIPGMTRERVRTILELRRRSAVSGDLADALGDAKAFTTNKPASATRIKVRAVLPDGFTTASEIVIVHYPDDGQPYRILSWDDDTDMRSMLRSP